MVINTKTDKTICQGYQKNQSYFLLLLAFFITFSLLQFQPCSVTRVVTRKSHVEKTTIYQIKKYFVFTSRDTQIFETMSSASHFSFYQFDYCNWISNSQDGGPVLSKRHLLNVHVRAQKKIFSAYNQVSSCIQILIPVK